MPNESVKRSDVPGEPERDASREPEVACTPKKATFWEQVVFAVKLFTIASLVVLVLWLVDSNL